MKESSKMANLVTIDNKQHRQVKIDASKAELHGKNLHLIPVVMSEFINLAVQYPIVITKNGDTGQFVFAAMLGFEEQENLFWNNEQWQGLYLPLQIRRQPFFVANPEEGSEQAQNGDYIVCLDQDSPTISAEGSLALFDAQGADTEYFQQAKSMLVALLSGEAQNQKLLELLEKMDLIQPMTLEITFANQTSNTLNGFYTIDQDKLSALSDAQLVALHKAEVLQPIYTLITSVGQIHALIALKNAKLSV